MSEVKRAKLISFGSERVNDKNSKEIRKTQRISVILPESTEDKCPEFNYKDELVAAKHKHLPKNSAPKLHQQQQTNGLDPFNEDDDDDVKRIAAEMEAKYGMGVAKKRKWRKDDYADIGMGYDESDSFIDNTDGYDEIIPKNVTTLHGGFYINCGALEFKTDEGMSTEDSSSSEEDTPEKSVNRKRILESSADSEEETQTENQENVEQPKKKQKLVSSTPGGPTNTNGMQKAIKKRLFSHDKIKQQMRKKQQRPDEQKKTVRELLKERRLDLNMTPALESESPEKTEPAASPKEIKKSPPLASVDDVIESVISKAVKKKDEPVDESSKDSTCSKDAVNNKSSALVSSEADSNDGLSIKPVEIVQLPENLPSDIIGIIDSIKKAAACSTEGKVKFFSGHVNTMLLNLERKCRCLGKQSRNKVYEHLAPFVKCRKETLIKRAKNLCVVEEQKKIKTLLDRLKSTVGIIMPPLIESYEEECRVVVQRKFSAVTTEEAARNVRMPKRQFCWTEEMKKLLRDIITLRKKLYISEGKQKDSLEKHLTEFLKTEIQVIWPDGWMSMSSLLKLCNIVPDVKKSVDPVVRKSSSASSPDLNITPTPSIAVNPSPIIPPPIIPPISSNAALTITPVTTNVHKVNSNEKIKPKTVTISETIISKVNSDNSSSIAKPSMPLPPADIVKTLPPADIVKTLPPDLNNVKYTHSASNSNNPALIKDDVDAIVIDESPIKKEDPEDLSTNVNTLNTVKPEVKHEIKDEIKTDPIPTKEKNSANHCQVIDLTDQPELKKRPGPKSKTKFLYEYPDKGHKIKKDSDHVRKSKEEITGSSALTQIIADSLSLSDYNRFAQSAPKNANSTVINNTAAVNNPSDSAVKKLGSNSYEYTKAKSTSEGDDIQKVMEGLKVLQKMSSPVKSNDEVKTSSPVSVIAYNKSYSHDSSSSTPHNSNIVTHRSNSFQDAFQKHFIPDFNLMKASQQAAASTSKGNYNSISKHNHTSTKSNSTSSDRYLQNSNNNYAQQNSSSKLKNSCSSQQSGSYDLLDDMFANFLSEYGQSKTANAKSSTQHK